MITQRKQSKIYVLAECAILVALGTVLSLLKLVDLPYGGSVTVASMLPLLIISYRHGMVWGLGCGLVYGAIQQLLGLNTLSYFSTFGSILAVILLDYVVAFAVVGLGGMFRKAVRNESVALAGGALVTGLLRYLCHVISGATVWAGISIPTKAAIGYSLIYNATYMIPETLVLMLVASMPCVLGFNVWSGFQPLGAGTGVLDLEDFLVSNLLLPIGSMVYLLFCVTKWGWGFDNYLAEANTGDGVRIPRWMKYYFMIPLPLLVLALIAQSLGLLPF